MKVDLYLDIAAHYDKDGKPRFYKKGEYRVPQQGELTISNGRIHETFMEPTRYSTKENIAVEIPLEVALVEVIKALTEE